MASGIGVLNNSKSIEFDRLSMIANDRPVLLKTVHFKTSKVHQTLNALVILLEVTFVHMLPNTQNLSLTSGQSFTDQQTVMITDSDEHSSWNPVSVLLESLDSIQLVRHLNLLEKKLELINLMQTLSILFTRMAATKMMVFLV